MNSLRKQYCRSLKSIFGLLFSLPYLCMSQEPARPVVQQVSFKNDTLNIIGHGAKGDGQFLNTAPINRAIKSCSEHGGGVVLIPSGLWLTGPIEMHSNVNLHLQRDAVLLFTTDFNQYKLVESNWEGEPAWRNQNPISGKNLNNIAITGNGIIDGNGDAWRMVKKSKMTASQWQNLVASGGTVDDTGNIWYPSESSLRGAQEKKAGVIRPGTTAEDFKNVKDFLRPNLLVFTNCKKVLLEGVTIQNSPAWNIHPLMCEDLTLRKLSVRNPWYGQNGDGVDVESCKNVLIEDCTFDVGDDGICIKSGRDKAGRDRGMPTENVIIRNNVVYHAHGGFVIGSEMSGGARNIWVDDCSFIGTDIGLRFKTTRGRGGVVENIFVNNINMIDIPGEAILFDMYYAAVDPVPMSGEKRPKVKRVTLPVTEETPQFKNFHIKNIKAKGASKGIFFRGLPEMHIQNILIEDATLEATKGIEIIEASQVNLKNITLKTLENNPLIHIYNSNDIKLENIQSITAPELLIQIAGQQSHNIMLSKSSTKAIKAVSQFIEGSTDKSLTIKN
ncbi:glycoside hydrolase family 28 protein [Sphingobacterium sp. N143]|uniref:glycoside hydrolase family 28 protein n=1 Tax=Sphingobacterium sp. N143 TaxID=2746727 RepID=UPI00257870F1|nr:glycoside hydrolase family 28 protein [Sphingobacterium sp. N143]MDM1293899.1 glycoside hydrolase family 28 protein [Sphingobacterium sp. N143]